MGAGTHSPSSTRPGPITDALRADFEARGYPLATAQPTGRAIVEVYPHPALIAFLGKEYRLSYKAGRVRHYWPDLVKEARRENLFAIWREIVTALDPLISGVSGALPLPRPDAGVAALKTFEDQLDAVICAAVGIEILAGRAIAYGDAASAIWVPRAACPAP